LKLRNKSITLKIFVYLLVFVVIIVGLLWFTQSVLLVKSYERNRISDIQRKTAFIISQMDGKDDDDFWKKIEGMAMREDFCLHYLDAEGNTIRRTEKFRDCVVHRMSTEELRAFLAEADANGGTALKTLQHKVPVFSQAPSESGPPHKAGEAPVESIAYAVKTTDSQGNACYVVVGTVITPLDATLLVLHQQMAYVTVFLIAAAAFLAWLMSRGIAKPIISINQSAKELTRHNYNVTFDTEGYREISELSSTLNDAAVELNKTEQLRRDLIANISHDLRTPLTMIVGYSEVMRDLPGENTPENVQVIIDEANRLSRLVEDVLDLSKLEANAEKMDLEPMNLSGAVDNMVGRCSHMTAKDGYVIRFEPRQQDAWVNGDDLKLSQVLYNLIGNALTHTGPDKQVLVSQRLGEHSVRINVTDYGEGIPEDKLSDIWQRYYKVDKTHKRSRVGTGLGLSIVKGIVECHGGRCGVESKLGEGSTFWFELPTVPPPAAGDP